MGDLFDLALEDKELQKFNLDEIESLSEESFRMERFEKEFYLDKIERESKQMIKKQKSQIMVDKLMSGMASLVQEKTRNENGEVVEIVDTSRRSEDNGPGYLFGTGKNK